MSEHITQLASGLTIATDHVHGARSVAIGVWVAVGSRDEPPTLSGVSHFLEHLLFKGTPTRTATDISRAVDRVGGDINAFTSKEYTAYYCRMPRRHAATGIELLGDVLTRSLLDRRRRRERAPGHPGGAGDGRRLARRRRPAHARPPAVRRPRPRPGHGGRARDGARRSPATTSARSSPSTTAPAPRRSPSPATSTTTMWSPRSAAASPTCPTGDGRIARGAPGPAETDVDIDDDSEQVHLAIGGRSVPRDDPDREALDVVNHVFGGGLSSRLFDEIRERRGLAYSVYSATSAYADAGAWSVYAGSMPEHAGEVDAARRSELERLVADGITDDELAVAIGYLTGAYELGLEDTGARMSRLGGMLATLGRVSRSTSSSPAGRRSPTPTCGRVIDRVYGAGRAGDRVRRPRLRSLTLVPPIGPSEA